MIKSGKQKNKPCCVNRVRIFLWLILAFVLSSCASANNSVQVTRENLYEEVKARAIEKGKPAFATAEVVSYLESMRSHNKQIKKIQWSSASKYEVLHLNTEKMDTLRIIATKNINEIINSKQQQIKIVDGTFISKGLSPKRIKRVFESVCGVVVKKLSQNTTLIISYQERLQPQGDLCKYFGWIFAGQGISVVSSGKGTVDWVEINGSAATQ